ncbi:MAG: M20 family metallopeptidase [Acidaminococcaceae bacterium]
MCNVKKGLEFIDDCQEEMISLWQRLVNMESGSANKDGVDKIQQEVAKELKSLGVTVKLHEFPQAGATLIGEMAGGAKAPVIFSGHVDTVFPLGETTRRPFKIEDGKAYGPGALDMKGGIVAFIYAIKALKEIGFNDRPIKILLAGDEEPGHPKSNAVELFTRESAGCVAAFNCETGFADNGIVVGRKGVGYYTMEVHGVACHFGNDPENGRSAVRELSHKVIDIENLTDLEKGIALGVGLISGGTVSNAAPAYARAEIDMRCTDENDLYAMADALRKIADKQYIPGTKTIVSGEIRFPAMQTTDGVAALFDYVKDLSKENGFSEPYPKFCGGGADSAHIVKAGIPTLCGMGVKGGRNHSKDEFALVDSLTERAKLLTLAVFNMDRFEQSLNKK